MTWQVEEEVDREAVDYDNDFQLVGGQMGQKQP